MENLIIFLIFFIDINFSLDMAEQLDSHQALVKQLAKVCVLSEYKQICRFFSDFSSISSGFGICAEV